MLSFRILYPDLVFHATHVVKNMCVVQPLILRLVLNIEALHLSQPPKMSLVT